jgi:hypothetical protein
MALAEQEWIKLNLMNEQVKAGVTNNDIKLPKLFSGDDWQNFGEHVDTYLNSLKGGSGVVPLNYIIQDDAVPDPNAIYASEQ